MASAEPQSRRAAFVGERLAVLQRLSSESVELLDVMDSTLADLSTLTAPIHSRATALTAAQRNIAVAVAALDELMQHLATPRRVSAALEAGPGRDLEAFLAALECLERSHSYLQAHAGLAAARTALARSQELFDASLHACDADFRAGVAPPGRGGAAAAAWLRERLQQSPATACAADAPPLELVPRELLPKLRREATLLLDSQYGPAQDGYLATRGHALKQALSTLGLLLQPIGGATPLPEQLARHLAAWGTALRALTLLLTAEAGLARGVWPAPVADALLGRLAEPQLGALLGVAAEVLGARTPPDKACALLVMHADAHAALSALDPLLHDAVAAPRVEELRAVHQRVAAAAGMALADYAAAISRDSGKVLPLDGTVHPLTAQVLSFAKRVLACDNAASVLAAHEARLDEGDGGPGLSGWLVSLLSGLLACLEAKARGYRCDALTALFMMNNAHYVACAVEGCAPALALLGHNWLEAAKDGVEEWGARYQEAAWGAIIAALRAPLPADPAALRAGLKDAYAAFNAALERIHAHQSGWTIPDAALRSAVRRVIKDDVLPVYAAFLRAHADVDFTATPAKYIRYAAADVAAIVDEDLFETKAVSMARLSLAKEKLGAIG